MTEYERMHNGLIYDCLDEELGKMQKYSHRLCEQYNKLGVDDEEEKQNLLRQLFPNDDFGGYRSMETPFSSTTAGKSPSAKTFTPTSIFRLLQAVRSRSGTTFLWDLTAHWQRASIR